MVCPHYNGNKDEGRCGLKAEAYGPLSKQHIEDHCKFNYQSCTTFVENLNNRLRNAQKGVEDRVQELDDASRSTPKIIRGEDFVSTNLT